MKAIISGIRGLWMAAVLGVFGLNAQGASLEASTPQERVVIETNLGDLIVSLNVDKAPLTVANFLNYVDQEGYAGTIFHRVISGFMIQGGGHFEDLSESVSNPAIRNEADNGLSNRMGTIAMARLSEIDSASNQFFINTADNPRLDHGPDSCSREEEAASAALRARGLIKPKRCKSFGYAVFGQVIDGMEVVRRIEGAETELKNGFYDVPIEPIKILTIKRIRP